MFHRCPNTNCNARVGNSEYHAVNTIIERHGIDCSNYNTHLCLKHLAAEHNIDLPNEPDVPTEEIDPILAATLRQVQ